MIVVHAAWSRNARLRLWGEDSSLPPRTGARRGRPAASPAPRPHPFACGAAALDAALGRLGVPLPSSTGGESVLTLTLPSSRRGPQASPQLLRPVEDDLAVERFDGLHAWNVPVLDLPASSVLDVALALPPGPVAGVVVGDSLRSLAEAAQLALELVARGRLRAALVRRGDAWAARWLAVTDEAQDATRVELLERSLPAVVSASPDAPQAVAREVVDAVVDACARELRSEDADDQQPRSAVDGWLSALAREDPVVRGDPWELAALAEQLDEWWDAGQRYAAQRMFRTCFRLVAPDEDEGHDAPHDPAAGDDDTGVEPPWRVEILLQSKEDPSLLVPAAEVWSHGERLTALGRMLENPQERLLGGLGHALGLWSDLAPALREAAPTEVALDADAAHRFLRDAVPALEQGGFAVLVPRWWSERLRVKLRVEPTTEWEDSSGLLGIDGLCSYEWRVAIGDATLSPSELRELAALKAPLVRARGRWVALRPEDVDAALRFFEGRRGKGQAQAGELLRVGLGLDGHGSPADSPTVELEAAGWLGELLAADGDRRLEAIPTPAGFAGELRPYQQRGLAWLAFMSSIGLGGCLADDMGLGKTIQLLALLLAEREAQVDGAKTANGARVPRRRRVGPTLLICPMSVAGNWQREAALRAKPAGARASRARADHGPRLRARRPRQRPRDHDLCARAA
ncbi:MAG: SNF2-related protein [Solirubrobacteraceae bacterium MAG38_C4-C5]|nr:SNF2-related protein [Candidatus Siliceabacter maunaloa]